MAQENESLAEKVARLDERQNAQEKEQARAMKIAEEAKEIAMETREAVTAMPQVIIEAIDKRGINRWSVANQWIVVGVAIAAPFIAKWLGV